MVLCLSWVQNILPAQFWHRRGGRTWSNILQRSDEGRGEVGSDSSWCVSRVVCGGTWCGSAVVNVGHRDFLNDSAFFYLIQGLLIVVIGHTDLRRCGKGV